MPDPLTFHGGESLILHSNSIFSKEDESIVLSKSQKKVVLSFFKEIPVNSFDNFDKFAKNVATCRQWLINKFY